MLEIALEGLLRRIIREEIGTLKAEVNDHDYLLDAEEAAKLLSVSEDWLDRHAKKLPFTRKLGPKMLRFSSLGIQKNGMYRHGLFLKEGVAERGIIRELLRQVHRMP